MAKCKTINKAIDNIVNGDCAIVNDVDINTLNYILNGLFPESYRCFQPSQFFIADPDYPSYWLGIEETDLPTINASELI